MGLIPGIGILTFKAKVNSVKKVENCVLVSSFYHGLTNNAGLAFESSGYYFYMIDNNLLSVESYYGGSYNLNSASYAFTSDYSAFGTMYGLATVAANYDFYFTCDYYIKEDKGFNQSIDSSVYASNAGAIWTTSNGTKLYYIVGSTLYECTLSTPHYVSSLTTTRTVALTTISASISAAYSMWVSNDGKQMLLGGYNGKLYQLIMSTPYNISTATLYSTFTIPSSVIGVFLDPTGTKLFLNYQNGYIRQYSMN